VENNTIGHTVLTKLKDMQYPNIYHSIKSTHEYVDELTAEQHSGAIAGFTMSMKTRPLVVAKFEEFIRNKLLKVYSKRLQHELTTFVWNNGKPEAMRSYNDDLIMACAIGCWVRDTAIVENQRGVEYSRALLSAMCASSSQLDTTIPGMNKPHETFNMDDKKREALKYAALLKG
jgi:hypothetical protein